MKELRDDGKTPGPKQTDGEEIPGQPAGPVQFLTHAQPRRESAGKTGNRVPPAGTHWHFQSKPWVTLAFTTSRLFREMPRNSQLRILPQQHTKHIPVFGNGT